MLSVTMPAGPCGRPGRLLAVPKARMSRGCMISATGPVPGYFPGRPHRSGYLQHWSVSTELLPAGSYQVMPVRHCDLPSGKNEYRTFAT
jgi:hypothetical protein